MPRTALHSVQTMRESVRDTERGRLAALLQVDQQLTSRLLELQHEQHEQLARVAGLSREGRFDVRAAGDGRYYASHLRRESLTIAKQRAELADQIDLQRRRLADADAAVKAVEKLIEKREAEERLALARREQLQIEDEWASTQAAR